LDVGFVQGRAEPRDVVQLLPCGPQTLDLGRGAGAEVRRRRLLLQVSDLAAQELAGPSGAAECLNDAGHHLRGTGVGQGFGQQVRRRLGVGKPVGLVKSALQVSSVGAAPPTQGGPAGPVEPSPPGCPLVTQVGQVRSSSATRAAVLGGSYSSSASA
jgi:hypothetical protein